MAVACLCAASCAKLARCQMDKVRADVLHYEEQCGPLAKQERELSGRIDELEGKIFTNQKAGVDLLKAVLVRATHAYADKLAAIQVRSDLLRPLHRKKVIAYKRLAQAYEQLMAAYPRADFDAIRRGLKLRERAMRDRAAAELQLARLIRKYKRRRRK